MKQIPASVVEGVVIDELRRLGLDQERVAALAGEAQETFTSALQPLVERRAKATAELERIKSRLDSLLELAEERLIAKEEYTARRARLEAQRADLDSELRTLEAAITSHAATVVDVEATMRSMRRVGNVFDELQDVVDRRRLLATCLNRVVLRAGEIELHVPAIPLLAAVSASADGTAKVPGFPHLAGVAEAQNGLENGQNTAKFPAGLNGGNGKSYGVGECMDAPVATSATR